MLIAVFTKYFRHRVETTEQSKGSAKSEAKQ